MSTGSEVDPKAVVDQKKRKRMMSNRDSARRSRLRKQQLLDELAAEELQLRTQNGQILNMLQLVNLNYVAVESENCVLRSQAVELSTRLESLNDRLNYYCSMNDGSLVLNPWNDLLVNQPIMATVDMSFLV